ncbi:MAG: DNA alkylation repair protein, partial [Candidatus Ornithomonoglobus sp.]
ENIRDFLNDLPHTYYEENNLHAFIVARIKDYETALAETKRFLPYIDNWATCDMFTPEVFRKNTEKLLPEIYEWIKSPHTYTVRYAIGLLMQLYLDDNFDESCMSLAASVRSEEYYVNMMIAWYFATALAKQYDAAIVYLTENRLDKWTHNKTIQKAVESNRIAPETKAYLKTLKR